MISKEEAEELHAHVTHALGCLTTAGGAFSTDSLSEAEARLTRASVLASLVLVDAAPTADPIAKGYMVGLLHHLFVAADRSMRDIVNVYVERDSGDLVVQPYAIAKGDGYRVRFELVPRNEPF